jgi:hypothetical protein
MFMSENNYRSEATKHPPTEEEITNLLKAFNPNPSEGYYQRMETAPWATSQKTGNRFSVFMQRLFGKDGTAPIPRLRVALASSVLVLVIVLITLASPSLQAVAQRILQFIIPAPTDALTLQVTVQPPGTQEALNAADRYPLTMTQVEEAAGYDVSVISILPQGVTFTGAQYNPNLQAVTLRYAGTGQTLLFTQRPLGNISEFTTVGASAPVEIVNIGESAAEFVTGGWKVTDSDDRIQTTAAPGTEINLGVYWDPTLPQRILRWQADNMQYEILSTKTEQGIDIDKEDLIAMAESID